MKLANKSFKNKKKITRPQEDWIVTENAHEALVSQQDFDSVQERLKSKQRINAPNNKNIFRGLVFCSDCNRSLVFSPSGGDGRFRCQANVRYGKGECTNHSISMKKLSALVLNDIQRHAGLVAESSAKYVRSCIHRRFKSVCRCEIVAIHSADDVLIS